MIKVQCWEKINKTGWTRPKSLHSTVTLNPLGKTRTIFLDCTDPIRIRILPSTSKKIKKNLDCYSFVTSFIHTCLKRQELFIIYFRSRQCCGSMTFWCGSGSADPCLWLMNPDADPDLESGSSYFRHWPSRCQQIRYPKLFFKFCLLITF